MSATKAVQSILTTPKVATSGGLTKEHTLCTKVYCLTEEELNECEDGWFSVEAHCLNIRCSECNERKIIQADSNRKIIKIQ